MDDSTGLSVNHFVKLIGTNGLVVLGYFIIVYWWCLLLGVAIG